MTKILWALLFSSLLSFAQAQKMAPDFSLLGNDLKMHSLKEHQGKYVVLEWYNKGCPFVRKHYDSGNMQALQKQFTQQGVVWYTIISSAPGKQGFLDDSTLQSEKKESKVTCPGKTVPEDMLFWTLKRSRYGEKEVHPRRDHSTFKNA